MENPSCAIQRTRRVVRFVTMAAMLTFMADPVGAGEPPDTGSTDCFSLVEREHRLHAPLTLYTSDSTVIKGTNPVVNHSTASVLLIVMPEAGHTTSREISFGKIDSLTFQRLSPKRSSYAGLGFVIGATAGALIAISAASATSKELYPLVPPSYDVKSGIIGIFFGGLAGALIGSTVGQHSVITVTVKCK